MDDGRRAILKKKSLTMKPPASTVQCGYRLTQDTARIAPIPCVRSSFYSTDSGTIGNIPEHT